MDVHAPVHKTQHMFRAANVFELYLKWLATHQHSVVATLALPRNWNGPEWTCKSCLGPLLLSRRAWALSRCANLHPASQNASQKFSGRECSEDRNSTEMLIFHHISKFAFRFCSQVLQALEEQKHGWRLASTSLAAWALLIKGTSWRDWTAMFVRISGKTSHAQPMLQDHFDIRRAWQLGRLLSTVVGNTSMLQRQGRDCDIRGKKVTRRGRRVKRKCERKYVW